ncbi:MAG TPA: hypothetical protein DCP92_08170, partial [Nitrospiraceae bacterium]|nr:hypothetical protein [Nitrospiraceae bacterium]
ANEVKQSRMPEPGLAYGCCAHRKRGFGFPSLSLGDAFRGVILSGLLLLRNDRKARTGLLP